MLYAIDQGRYNPPSHPVAGPGLPSDQWWGAVELTPSQANSVSSQRRITYTVPPKLSFKLQSSAVHMPNWLCTRENHHIPDAGLRKRAQLLHHSGHQQYRNVGGSSYDEYRSHFSGYESVDPAFRPRTRSPFQDTCVGNLIFRASLSHVCVSISRSMLEQDLRIIAVRTMLAISWHISR